MSLSAEATKILKATAPVVREHGPAITTAMYRIMIEEHPEIKGLFNNSHLRQTDAGQVSPQVRRSSANGNKYEITSTLIPIHAYA